MLIDIHSDQRSAAGFYKFVVHNVKDLELLLMHNRYATYMPAVVLHKAVST